MRRYCCSFLLACLILSFVGCTSVNSARMMNPFSTGLPELSEPPVTAE